MALLNPAQVKENRAQDLHRGLKSDQRDLGAMAELLIRGKGHPTAFSDSALATQAALVAHRARKVMARTAVKNHIHKSLDLVFRGSRDASRRSWTPRWAGWWWPRGWTPLASAGWDRSDCGRSASVGGSG